MNRPEITWSLMHPTPLDPVYVKKLVKKSEEYTVDSFEICGQCHTPYGGLDGLINYREYPAAFASWDQDKVADNQRKLNEILAISHAAGTAEFILTENGIYEIEYNTVVASSVNPTFTVALHLELNGDIILASRSSVSISAAADEQTLSGRAVITLSNAPATITLVAEDSNGTYSDTVLTIQKLD